MEPAAPHAQTHECSPLRARLRGALPRASCAPLERPKGKRTLLEAAAFPPSLNNFLLQGNAQPFRFPPHACPGRGTRRAQPSRGVAGSGGAGKRRAMKPAC